MGFETRWEGTTTRVLHLTYVGQWQWEDVNQSRIQVNRMLDELLAPVAVVVEWNNESWMPPNAYRNLARLDLQDASHPNVGVLIFVLKSDLFRTLAHFYAQSKGRCSFDIAKSYDRALELVELHTEHP